MKKTIVVVDGMGGGIGAQLVERVRELLGDGVEVIALGTNSAATERMLKAGADRGASGENAVAVAVALGDVILGPIGAAIPNGLMGEISDRVATAVLAARGRRVLVPVPQDHFTLVGLEQLPIGKLVSLAAAEAARLVGGSASE
jgi:D-arabinose 1-dehydrogenase-like Zn-dependent alcohol dehydrogenase